MNTKLKIWEPSKTTENKGVVFIVHGMAEHSKRYAGIGEFLSQNGYTVSMIDHKSHGTNIESLDKLGFIDDDFKSSREEIKLAIEETRNKNIGKPLFILGHSMGSFITQILFEEGVKNDGIILSGSSRPMKIAVKTAHTIASLLTKIKNKRSFVFDKLIFGLHNMKFKGKSKFRWLTRDEKIVDDYKKDPLCGFVPYLSYYKGLFSMIGKTLEVGDKKKNTHIPLYIFSGQDDPVGEYGSGTKKLYNFYKEMGYKDIELKLYPEGRHEMFNELNKEEVYSDLLHWLNRRT